jgi:hypothetical protein
LPTLYENMPLSDIYLISSKNIKYYKFSVFKAVNEGYCIMRFHCFLSRI